MQEVPGPKVVTGSSTKMFEGVLLRPQYTVSVVWMLLDAHVFIFFEAIVGSVVRGFLVLNFETWHRELYWNLGAWITSVSCLVIAFSPYPISPTIPRQLCPPATRSWGMGWKMRTDIIDEANVTSSGPRDLLDEEIGRHGFGLFVNRGWECVRGKIRGKNLVGSIKCGRAKLKVSQMHRLIPGQGGGRTTSTVFDIPQIQ